MTRRAIVLAGGEGVRLRSSLEAAFGTSCPKQYCTFTGTRSMLSHTLDRAAELVGENNLLTILGTGHRKYLSNSKPVGRLIEQPASRGTGGGVLLGLLTTLTTDADSVVFVFPSDHFIYPESAFLKQCHRLALLAEAFPYKLALMAAVPTRPEVDFGWIRPGSRISGWSWGDGQQAHQVDAFHEKPTRKRAALFLSSGFFWNTLIMAFRAQFFWELARQLVPAGIRPLESYLLHNRQRQLSPGDLESDDYLKVLWDNLPPVDLSRNLLAAASDHCVMLPLHGMEWSDWGRPERVNQALSWLGSSRPVFKTAG